MTREEEAKELVDKFTIIEPIKETKITYWIKLKTNKMTQSAFDDLPNIDLIELSRIAASGEITAYKHGFNQGFDAALNVIIKYIDCDLSNLDKEDVQGHHYLLGFKKLVETLSSIKNGHQ